MSKFNRSKSAEARPNKRDVLADFKVISERFIAPCPGDYFHETVEGEGKHRQITNYRIDVGKM